MTENKHEIIGIIPTHGAGDAFVECSTSILNQSQPLTELIIVNNNVKDGSVEKLINSLNIEINQTENIQTGKYKETEVKIIFLSENTGVTGGRNAGIKALPQHYDFACFIDHDMIANPSMVEELVKIATSDEKIGIVTPKIYYWDDKTIIWSSGTDIDLLTGRTLFRGGRDTGQFDLAQQVAVAPATFIVKKAVIDKIQQFDPVYFAVYEDTDFCFRAKQAGFSTFYAPKAVTYHKIPLDENLSNKRLLERTYWVARNRIIFMKKFGKNFSIFLLFMFAYLFYYLILSLRYKEYAAVPNYIKGVFAGLVYKKS